MMHHSKPKRKPTPKKQPQILKQQSSKIQSKLDALRQQITERKKQKDCDRHKKSIQNSTQSSELFRSTQASHSNNNMGVKNVEKFLKNGNNQNKNIQVYQDTIVSNKNRYEQNPSHVNQLLKSLKLPQSIFKNCLQQRKIETIQQFLLSSESQIDQWKQIAIGHRIKLKKFIRIAQQEHQLQKLSKLSENGVIQTFQSPINEIKIENIQDIVNRREKERKFIKISDREEQNWDGQDHLQLQQQQPKIQQFPQFQDKNHCVEDEEDFMMSSLTEAFFGEQQRRIRKSIIRKSSYKNQSSEMLDSPKQKKQVKWHKNVKQYDRSNRKVLTEKIQLIRLNNQDYESQQNPQISKTRIDHSKKLFANDKKNGHKYYCWNCLKKLQNSTAQKQTNRNYCCQICQEQYLKMTGLASQTQKNIQQRAKIDKKVNDGDSGQSIDENQYDETIDLSVI